MIAFIDESKAKEYLLVVSLIEQYDLQRKRKILASKLLAGQRSFHFRKESNSRRRHLIKIIDSLNPEIVVLKARGLSRIEARKRLIVALCASAQKYQVSELVFELDEMSLEYDNKVLREQGTSIRWDHRERHHEPLLWIADAVAWCVNRGGDWERLVRPMVVEVIEC